jgi:hypothetical protein
MPASPRWEVGLAFSMTGQRHNHRTFTRVTPGGKMSTPTGDNAFLHELELNVREELALAETSQPGEEADGVPAFGWLPDPDAQRYEVGLRNLLGAVEALEDGPCPDDHAP